MCLKGQSEDVKALYLKIHRKDVLYCMRGPSDISGASVKWTTDSMKIGKAVNLCWWMLLIKRNNEKHDWTSAGAVWRYKIWLVRMKVSSESTWEHSLQTNLYYCWQHTKGISSCFTSSFSFCSLHFRSRVIALLQQDLHINPHWCVRVPTADTSCSGGEGSILLTAHCLPKETEPASGNTTFP